jgi:hypothetical protein
MKLSYSLAVITAAIWALLALCGHDLLEGSKAQKVPDYPFPGQADYYVHFPILVFVVVLAACVASRYRPLRIPAYVVYTLALLALPPFLFFYTGGM